MTDKETLIKLAIERNQVPQFLSKYKSQDFLVDLFINNELWFSSPLSFNDPFDCQINLSTENNTRDEIESFFSGAPVSKERISEAVEKFASNPEEWYNFMNDAAKKSVNRNGVCCFSKKEDNLLLWSHYGDSHRGVCIKFNIVEDPDFFYFPVAVKYDTNYPIYNHLKSRDQILSSLMLTKSKVWSYEEEYRVIKLEKLGGQKLTKKSFVEIIFGCRCDEKFIHKIITLTKALDYNLTYKRASINRSNFSLDFEIIHW